MNDSLEIIVKITKYKGIQIGRSVILFGKPRMVVGFWNNSLVFATDKPQTMPEAQVLIYSVFELADFYKAGDLKGLVDLK